MSPSCFIVNFRRTFLLLVILSALMLLWLFLVRSSEKPATEKIAGARPAIVADGTAVPPEQKSKALPPLEISDAARDLNSSTTDIRADLRLLEDILATFRSNFPHEGNPAGSNAEITRVLTGQNKLRLALVAPHHPAINADGELCDRWGRPFFFHQLSATQIEIRSAGPDRKMWTEDDVVLTP